MNLLKIKILAEKRAGGLKKLAKDIEMSEANLHRCINSNKIQATDLEKIASIFNIPIGYFFDTACCMETINIKNSKDVIVNTGTANDNNINKTNQTMDEAIKDMSVNYQNIIKTYQEQTNKLITVIDKLAEKQN